MLCYVMLCMYVCMYVSLAGSCIAVLLRSNLQVAERVRGPPLRLLERHSVAITVEVARGTLSCLTFRACGRTLYIPHGPSPACPVLGSNFRAVRTAFSVCASRSAMQQICMYVCMYVMLCYVMLCYVMLCVLFICFVCFVCYVC